MANSIYLENSIENALAAMPDEKRENLFNALEKLRLDPFQNTHALPDFDLRTMVVEGQRVYFRYVPEKSTVLVTSISPEIELISA